MIKDNIQNIYKLSPMQSDMYYHCLNHSDPDIYINQERYKIKCRLNIKKIEEAFAQLINRHDVLRTVFVQKKGEVLQVVLKKSVPYFRYEDLSIEMHPENTFDEIQRQNRVLGMDLKRGPLIRLSVFFEGQGVYTLLLEYHHIILDGWSTAILLRELFAIYSGKASLLSSPCQYKEYIRWLEKRNPEDAVDFWDKYLENIETSACGFEFLQNSSGDVDWNGRTSSYTIAADKTNQLHDLAAKYSVTLNTMITTLWGLMAAKMNDAHDATFGMIMSGRHSGIANIETACGLFINTVPVRIRYDKENTFEELIKQQQEAYFAIDSHSYENLAQIQTRVGKTLVEYIIVYENYPSAFSKDSNQLLEMELLETDSAEHGSYPLTILIIPNECVHLRFLYNANVYSEDSIALMQQCFEILVDAILNVPNLALGNVPIIAPHEIEEQLNIYRSNIYKPNDRRTLIDVIHEVAQKYPDRPAVSSNESLSYMELDGRSNQMAEYITARTEGKKQRIALMMDRSISMIVSILGILKAGCIYVPIEASLPEQRIRYILEDCHAFMVLINGNHLEKVDRLHSLIINVDNCLSDFQPSGSILNWPSSEDTAYVIYTSGSTGDPKGVSVNHGSLLNRIRWQSRKTPIEAEDVFMQKTSSSFDVSIMEYFFPLYSGANLYMLEQGAEKDVSRILEGIRCSNTTLIHFVPSMFQVFLDFLSENHQYISFVEQLKYVYTSGEALLPAHVELFYHLLGHTQAVLINQYGPTEATVDVAFYVCRERHPKIVPIGRAIDNTGLFAVNRDGLLQPAGIPGELCIVGTPLAQGYINNQKQTEEKFIPCPFIPNTTMYRTGDLIKVLPDRNIAYLGRIDRQVKIRGFRIELSEVENALLSIAEITNAVAVASKVNGGNNILAAYYCTGKQRKDDQSLKKKNYEYRKLLKEKLPEYMVPTLFIELDEIPVLTNGKADVSQLLNPYRYMHTESLCEMTDVEGRISKIWSSALSIGTDMIDCDSDFILLGGHSITAIRVAYQLNAEFGVELSPADIFQYPSLSELALYIQEIGCTGTLQQIPLAPPKNGYKVTFAQRRLYTLEQLFRMGLSYNIVNSYRIKGALSPERIACVWEQLSSRHEVLRVRFDMQEGEVLQYIEDECPVDIYYAKVNICNVDEHLRCLIKPLSLNIAPLYKLYLFDLGDDCWQFTMQIHHIIADGLSISLLMKEFYELYQGIALPKMELSFLDYAEWQNGEVYQERLSKQKTFWMNRFEEKSPALNLEADYPRPSVQSFQGDQIPLILDARIGRQIERFCRSNKVTVNAFMLSALFVLLYKHTSTKDIVIGIPVSGRNVPGSENLVGMFINTICIRGYIEPECAFIDFVKTIHINLMDAISNQEYPFEKLVNDLKLDKETSHNPLFGISFSYRSNDSSNVLQSEALSITPYSYNKGSSLFDINIEAVAAEEGEIKIAIQFSMDLFKRSSIERMAGHYKTIIADGIQNSNTSVREIRFMTTQEKEWLTALYTRGSGSYKQETIDDLFLRQVKLHPEKTAVRCLDRDMTYKELNQRAEQIAFCLYANGLKKGGIVALLLNRSIDMIAAILGVLKAGGVYLPIDRAAPDERKQFIVRDSGASHILYESAADITGENHAVCIEIQQACAYPNKNIKAEVNPSDYAYIIYTSGTTGNPKGVRISHANVLSLLFPQKQLFDFSHSDVWTMYHNYSFDFSVWEMYGALLYGGLLVIVRDNIAKDPHEFRKLLIRERVTVLNMTPMAFYQLSNIELQGSKEEMNLRYIIFGGEALNLMQLLDWHSRYGDVQFINMYGITETTVHATYKRIEESDMYHMESNIGKAIPTLCTYIMDESWRLLPPGIVGEICIEGEGVSDGYLFRPELTEQKFIDHPLCIQSKLFCSGDLGKLLNNGEICYIGRKDKQVKVRGYRVELGEIEKRLLSVEGIDKVVLLTAKDQMGNVNIWAFYVTKKKLSTREIRDELNLYLPNYMIPSHFIRLDTIPMTQNGKVDIRNLEGIIQSYRIEAETESDDTIDLQDVLLHHCGYILQNDVIRPEDDFFDMGGDSIKIIQLSNRLNKYGYRLDIQSIFSHPVLKDLARYIKRLESTVSLENVSVSILTPIQNWFFTRGDKNIHFYNQSIALALKERIQLTTMSQAVQKVMMHHDSLRTLFVQENENIVTTTIGQQTVDQLYQIEEIEAGKKNDTEISDLFARKKRNLNLFTGPILNMVILHFKDRDQLFITIHHMYIDGISWNIFLEDLDAAYRSLRQHEEVILPRKTASYALWSRELERYSRDSAFTKQIALWEEMLSGEPLFNHCVQTYETVKELEIRLDESNTNRLSYSRIKTLGVRVVDVLIAALSKTIYDICQKGSATIYMEGHGRDSVAQDVHVTRTIGWFTAIYPVKLDGKFSDLIDLLTHTASTFKRIPYGGIGYGILKYLSADPALQGMEEHRDILFNYLGHLHYKHNEMEVEITEIDDVEYTDPQNNFIYAMEMNSYIKNDELVLRVSYSETQFGTEWIQLFTSKYLQNIRDLIELCTENDHAGYTQRLVLPSITPYNKIFFIDCFYNMLFSLLSGYNLNLEPFFANSLWIYEAHSGGFAGMRVANQVPLEELLNSIGLEVYTIDTSTNIVDIVRQSLLEGKTCLVQIDAYYQPTRKDTYETEHWPHALAIYGFNNNNGVFDIIEHEKKNTLSFQPMKIRYEDLRSCYEGYLRHFYQSGTPTFMSIDKIETTPAFVADEWKKRYLHLLNSNKENIIKGIEQCQSEIFELTDTQVGFDQLMYNLDMIINANDFLRHQNELFLQGENMDELTALRNLWLKARLLLQRAVVGGQETVVAWPPIRNIVYSAFTMEKRLYEKYSSPTAFHSSTMEDSVL